MSETGFAEPFAKRLGLEKSISRHCRDWSILIDKIRDIKKGGRKVKIALVGKYVEMHDAYLSVAEALRHGGFENGVDIDIDWVQSEDINSGTVSSILSDCRGIIVPGGFGDRGTEGMIEAIKYARENDIPFFGICLGMQMAVVEYARNVLGYKNANSREFHPESEHCVIDLMLEQKDVENMGGTMRLGLYPCRLSENSKAHKAYNDDLIYERHRHRYEFNNTYRTEFEEKGLLLSGLSPDGKLVEIIEDPSRKWFVGSQFHP